MKITFVHPTSTGNSDLVAYKIDNDGNIYDVTNDAWATPVVANWDDYDIALAEVVAGTYIYASAELTTVAMNRAASIVVYDTGGSTAAPGQTYIGGNSPVDISSVAGTEVGSNAKNRYKAGQ